MRPNIIDVVGGSVQDQNSDSAICDVLLIPEILVHGDQDVKVSFCKRKQLTIFFASEASFAHCFALVATA